MPERVVGRQQADRRRRHAHDQQRQIEHGLAADLVAEMTEHDPAERPRNEAQGVGAERQQRTHRRIECRKEQFVEDQRRGGAVQEEVVPLDGGADQTGGCYGDVRRPFCSQLVDHCCPQFDYRERQNPAPTVNRTAGRTSIQLSDNMKRSALAVLTQINHARADNVSKDRFRD